MKKLEPGERYNRFQAKKKPRKVFKDPLAKEKNEQLVKIAKQGGSLRKKVAIMGLI